jgi:hypothetical protein
MNEIRIERSVRRKIAEVCCCISGVCLALYSVSTQRTLRSTPHCACRLSAFAAAVQTLIWIGGLVFLGFFAHFAPVKMTLAGKQGPALR